MLIMPCRASASRCRVQVTSNVRHPRRENSKTASHALRGRFPTLGFARLQSGRRREPEAVGWHRQVLGLQPNLKTEFGQGLWSRFAGASRGSASRAPRPGVIQFVGPAAVGRNTRFGPRRAAAGKTKARDCGCALSRFLGQAVAASSTCQPHELPREVCLTLR
jgi:hypothetical protein